MSPNELFSMQQLKVLSDPMTWTPLHAFVTILGAPAWLLLCCFSPGCHYINLCSREAGEFLGSVHAQHHEC
jgi:hypothetical protein